MTAALISSLLGGAVLILALGCERGDTDRELRARSGAAPDSDSTLRSEAAYAGVDWMLAHWRDMPPGWAYANLSRLQHVIGPGPRAEQITAVLRQDAAGSNHPELPADLEQPETLESTYLTRTLFELLRRREIGLPWQDQAEAIGRLASKDEFRFWKSLPLRHRPTVVHLFDELGIATHMRLEAVTEALRLAAAEKGNEALADNTPYIYAITHVVFARSRYFKRFVDPTGLEFALPLLRRALTERLPRTSDVFTLDLVGEVLASLQLMGAADDDITRMARRRLIALQNEDGSWGTGDGATPRKIHPTFNSIVALLEYPADLPRQPSP